MNKRFKKFLSFYKPYKSIFIKDMLCALLAAGITLTYPMILRYITNTVLVNNEIDEAVGIIIKLACVMLGLAIIEMLCDWEAMSLKFGTSTLKWYENDAKDEKAALSPKTKEIVEDLLYNVLHNSISKY